MNKQLALVCTCIFIIAIAISFVAILVQTDTVCPVCVHVSVAKHHLNFPLPIELHYSSALPLSLFFWARES